MMQDKWTDWVSVQGKWSRCTCLSDVLRDKFCRGWIWHRPTYSIRRCICVYVCVFVMWRARVCVWGGCVWLSLTASEGAGFILALIMRERLANALKSFLLFFHPSCCIRLLSPLIRPFFFFSSVEHRSHHSAHLSRQLSANFNILP